MWDLGQESSRQMAASKLQLLVSSQLAYSVVMVGDHGGGAGERGGKGGDVDGAREE